MLGMHYSASFRQKIGERMHKKDNNEYILLETEWCCGCTKKRIFFWKCASPRKPGFQKPSGITKANSKKKKGHNQRSFNLPLFLNWFFLSQSWAWLCQSRVRFCSDWPYWLAAFHWAWVTALGSAWACWRGRKCGGT